MSSDKRKHRQSVMKAVRAYSEGCQLRRTPLKKKNRCGGMYRRNKGDNWSF